MLEADLRLPRSEEHQPDGGRSAAGGHLRGWPARAGRLLVQRRVHRSPPRAKEALDSWANALTLTRAAVVTAVLVLAILEDSRGLLLMGLIASWIGDICDGGLARRAGRETVIGAQLDGFADRLTAVFVIAGALVLADGWTIALVAAAVAWVQFGVLDHLLSVQFLRFDLWSADEFHRVDDRVWLVNWSPIAKMASGVPLLLLALGGAFAWPASVLALMLVVLRLWSFLHLHGRVADWNAAPDRERAAEAPVSA